MVGELGHDDLGQQSRPGDAALNRPAGRGALDDPVAAGTGPLAPHMAQHLEGGADDFELFRDVIAEMLEATATLHANHLVGS